MPAKSTWQDLTVEAHEAGYSPPRMFTPLGFNRTKAKAAQDLYSRLIHAERHWPTWPFELKQVYLLLPIGGELNSICKLLDYEPEEIEKMIDGCESFQRALRYYLHHGDYPPVLSAKTSDKPNRKKNLKHTEILSVFMMEASVIAAAKLPQKATPVQIMEMIRQAGTLARTPQVEGEMGGREGTEDDPYVDDPTHGEEPMPLQRFDREPVES